MERNELIGLNLAALRGAMSQRELADLMRERGHKWGNATVWAIEKGQRPLKFTEVVDLAAILDFRRVDALLQPVTTTAADDEVRAAMDSALDDYDQVQQALAEATEKLEESRGKVAEVVKLATENQVALGRARAKRLEAAVNRIDH